MSTGAGLPRYDETHHGGIQPAVADGLHPMANRYLPVGEGLHPIVYAPEVVPPVQSYRYEDKIRVENKAGTEVEAQALGTKKSRFSRKCIWISVIVLVVVIAAAVGGGVGGSMVSNNPSNNEDTPQGIATNTSPASNTSSSTTPSSSEETSPTPSTSTDPPPPEETSSAASASTAPSTITAPTLPSPTETASVFWANARGYYDACYTDNEDRVLRGPNFASNYMTQQICAGLCDGYPLFGLEAGNQCWCGNELEPGYERTPNTQCNFACYGDSSQICGGYWTISVFSRDPVDATVPAYDLVGCVADNEDRVLTGEMFDMDRLTTTELCAGLCTGYTYFGLETGTQCFCGNQLSFNEPAASSMCNFTCGGDDADQCGGVWFLDLYSF